MVDSVCMTRMETTHLASLLASQSSVKAFEEFDIHILTVASFLDHLKARPVFTLTDVGTNTEHPFHIVPGTTASPAKVHLNADDASATAERWMHQQGEDFHTSILPYVLTMNISIDALRAARHTGLKFCINDWYGGCYVTTCLSYPAYISLKPSLFTWLYRTH